MKTAVLCMIGLVGSWGPAAAESLVEGRVRLDSGQPVPGARVLLFDLTDLRAAPLAATTDGSGRFTLPLGTLAGALPERFELGANYPNPFNPSTMIPYQLPAAMPVRLEVFNILGQQVATLVDGDQPAGFHTVSWDATDAAGEAVGAGVYLYRLSGDGVQATRSMLLIDGQAGIPWGGSTGSGGEVAEEAGGQAPVYGLTVSGLGLVPYVDPAFRVEAGMAPLEVVVTAPASVPASGKAASSGGILGDVDNTGGVDFFDALLVALYSRDSSIVMPNNGDISLGDVNADGQVDLSDAWLIAAYLNDPSDPSLPSGIGEPVGPAASLSPDPRRVAFIDDGSWHRFAVEAGEAVSVVVNPTGTPRRLEITTRSGRGNFCPPEADDDISRQDGQTLYLSGCTEGSATVELRREGNGTVLRTYTFEVTASPADLVVESVSVSDSTLTPGQSFTLSATVRNQGTGPSAATTLRYYRSSNRTISTQDTRIGTDAVDALAATGTSVESIELTAPSAEGTYYYGACVVRVSGERGGNNCSDAVPIAVNVAPAGVGTGGETEGIDHWLTIQSFEVSDNSLTAWQSFFTLETTVRNPGGTARGARLDFFRSTDATIDSTDALIAVDYHSVTGLEPSATQTVSLDWRAPPYAGTYYYGVCVFPWWNSFGNCSTGVRVSVEGSMGGTPDLTVHPPSVTHSIVTPAGRTTIETVIDNIGTGPAAPTTMRPYVSNDAIIDPEDDQGIPEAAGPILVGKGWIWIHHFQAPPVSGTYYYGTCVDPTIGETNLDNNCSVGVPVTVKADEGGSPDLIVIEPSILDLRSRPDEFKVEVWVRNTGSGLAADPIVDYYRSVDSTIDVTDTPIGANYPIPSLDIDFPYNLVSNPVTAPPSPGTHYFGACVRPVPGESDTNNNCSKPVPMNVGVPDLAVGLTWASTSVPLAGQSFTLRATVRNQGPDEAASTMLRYYRSDDATIDANDTPIGTGTVNSLTGFDGLVSGPGTRLAPSGISRQAISVSAPASPGTYYYGACADAVPNETHMDNNCSTGAYFRVAPSGADPFNIELVFDGHFTDARKDVMQQAARRWETIIAEGLPEVDFSVHHFLFVDDDGSVAVEIDDTVDDLRIIVHKDDLGGPVGLGGPAYVRSGNPTGLPALGQVWIDGSFLTNIPQWAPLWLEERLVRDLMLHEIAHVLGFGSLWADSDLLHDDLDRTNFDGDPYFSGGRAIEAFNAAGGESYSGKRVPVEFRRAKSSCGLPAHWRAHVFRGHNREIGAEIMEPTMQRQHALSAITIQSLADLGYVVDVSRADPYRLPASVGTAQPPTALPPMAGGKPVASYSDLTLGAFGPIYVGDEQGNIIRTIDSDWLE